MGTPVSPSATPAFPPTITPPNNGDPLDAAVLATDVEVPLQDGVEAARLLLYGGHIRRRMSCTDGLTLNIEAVGAVVVQVAGVWTCYPNTTAGAANAITISAPAANTRYYVYGYALAGALAFTASTTAPDANLFYMSGNLGYMYIGTCYTNSVGGILPFTQVDDTYMYTDWSPTSSNCFLNISAAGASGTQAFGSSLPSFAKQALIACYSQTTDAGPNSAGITYDPSKFNSVNLITFTGRPAGGQMWLANVGALGNTIDWYTSGSGNDVIRAWVAGFRM